jgi:hypothetical protein
MLICIILVAKPEELGSPGRKWEGNFKMEKGDTVRGYELDLSGPG